MGNLDEEAVVSVGSRIVLKESYGTVKYYGQVHGMQGQWYGVDWDSSERGKHDGSYAGIKYFDTRHPTSGSFVDPSKVDVGRSLAAAIEERYGDCLAPMTDEERRLPQKTSHQSHERLIEFVGAEKVCGKIRQLQKLQEGGFHESGISSAGDLAALAPKLSHLVLSVNLISDWNTIMEIVRQLPSLTSMVLSGNRLKIPSEPLPSLLQLSTLVLNNMDLNWSEVIHCSAMWHNVRHLSLLQNNIDTLDTPTGALLNLTELELSENQIASWEEVLKLGHLPQLASLKLINTSLSSITVPETSLFPALQSLNLSKNHLATWRDVSELNKLQRLEKLSLSGNPVLELEKHETSRQLVIAKIASLHFLEAMEITRQERRGAEIDYLKKYLADSQKRETNPGEFLLEHPRYVTLMKIHGESDRQEAVQNEKISVVSVSICCPLMPEKQPIVHKIPTMLTVGKVKALVKRLLKIKEKRLILSYMSGQGDGPEYNMDSDVKQMSFYSMDDGDRLIVRW